jgi:hypothetical protein
MPKIGDQNQIDSNVQRKKMRVTGNETITRYMQLVTYFEGRIRL